MAEKELKNLLNPCVGGDLGQIVRRARELGELTGALANSLPEEYAEALARRGLRLPFETITREDRLNEKVVATLTGLAFGALPAWQAFWRRDHFGYNISIKKGGGDGRQYLYQLRSQG